MRRLPERPTKTRVKFTVSYPGDIDAEYQARLAKLQMTPQQHYESMLAFDMFLEKAHILTGDSMRGGRDQAWELWREVVAEFGNPDKQAVGYFEGVLKRMREKGFMQDAPPL